MVVLTDFHLCQFVFPLYYDRNTFIFLQSHKTRIVFVSEHVVFLLRCQIPVLYNFKLHL